MTIWITLRTAVSVNIAPAQPEEIVEMFEEVKRGKRVYDAFGRDVTAEVVDTIVSWYEYDAGKMILEKKVCEFFNKLKGDARDIVLAAAIARFYRINVDALTVAKAIWNKDPSLIPTPPVCSK
jgi:hypothetical protein